MLRMEIKSILLVEDDPDLRSIMQSELEDLLGVRVVVAEDGAVAYRKARNQNFSLIVTDFKMPKVTGGQLISALRENEMNEETPIILYSGFIEEAKKNIEGMYRGLTFVEKPCPMEDFIKIIKNAFKNKTEKPKKKADAGFLNIFIDSTIFTLKNLCGCTKVAHKDVGRFEEKLPEVKVAANLNVLSQYFSGIITISFPEKTYLNILSFINDEEEKGITEENMDFAAETLNIIYGQAKRDLTAKGFDLQKVIPNVMGETSYHTFEEKLIKSDTILIPFETDMGQLYMNIYLKPGKG